VAEALKPEHGLENVSDLKSWAASAVYAFRNGVGHTWTFQSESLRRVLAKGTLDRDGMRWIQAEHRVRPELLVAQTGYMQGAAGIGMLLLHPDGFQHRKKPSIVFPDSPFD
jgi:hypothetical protein